MTEKLELYKCEVCGNIVEVIIPCGNRAIFTSEKAQITYFAVMIK